MKFNKILTIVILAVCLVSIGFVGAVGAEATLSGASITADSTSGTAPLTVNLEATVTNTGDDNVEYSWSCSPSATFTPASGKTTSVTFNDAGDYTITLTVTNMSDTTGTDKTDATKKITVSATQTAGEISVTLAEVKIDGTPATTASVTGTGVKSTPSKITWEDNPTKFTGGQTYKVTIELSADDNYVFSANPDISINDDDPDSSSISVSSDKKTVTFTKSYTTEATTQTPVVDSFEATPLSGESPLTVKFTYNISNMETGDIYLMCGTEQLAKTTYPSSTISYTFQTYGSYEVTLKAINGDKSGISNPKTITVADGGLISNVYLEIEAPSVGETPATSSEVTGDGITCTKIEWDTNPNFTAPLASDAKFAANTKYNVKVTLTNASNYHFGTTAPTVYINDVNVKNYGTSVVELNGQTLTVVYQNFASTSSDISSVSANVTAPATGRAPSESATLGASTYKASSVKWYKDGTTTAMNTTDKFETNTKYKVTIVLEASGSNAFNSSLGITNAKINGNDPSEFKRDSSTQVTMSYLFPATVTPTGPGITFTMDPTSPKIPSTSNSIAVKFTYTITGDPTSSILDFGDGVQKDLGSQSSGSITHEYTMLGSYSATLTSTNADATTSKQLTFSVTKDSLIAKIAASPSSGAAPLKVTLKDASTGTISSRVWDFGDGSGSSTDSSVTHTYEKPGTYTVTLTVSDGKDTSKAISAITVSEAADTESENKTAVNYEPLMTIGDIEIPSPLDLIAEFIRLFQSMIDFDNYTIFSSSESEEE